MSLLLLFFLKHNFLFFEKNIFQNTTMDPAFRLMHFPLEWRARFLFEKLIC